MREYKNPIVFWHGENEPYPVKSANLLKQYLPQMKKRVYKNMGHGQILHEYPRAYAKRIRSFMNEKNWGQCPRSMDEQKSWGNAPGI
ncbi:MAG: hypothetical protein IKN79_01690 [Eubacterium sp.]|nr:hypothetical protein [Eubacterium sp.]